MSKKTFAQIKKLIAGGFESSTGLTPEFRSFSTKFRNAMKKALAEQGAELVNFSRGHFYCSGFYRIDGQMGYFSISDVRSGLQDWPGHIMFRTAQHEKDYTGGSNNWGSFDDDKVAERMVNLIA